MNSQLKTAMFVDIAATIPHLHPFALTLLLVTPSSLNDIKGDDAKIRDFLTTANIPSSTHQEYLDFIHAINSDSDFQKIIPTLQNLLLNNLSVFYPVAPCPRPNDSLDIMKRLS